MYVRFIGHKVCYTLPSGRFLMVEQDEVTEAELAVCWLGGGDMPLSDIIDFLAR